MADLQLMSGDYLARKHVVFIHGLGGNPETTWQSNNSEKVFWPVWLNEDIEDCCIWTIGYEAPMFVSLDAGMGIYRAKIVFDDERESEREKYGFLIVPHSVAIFNTVPQKRRNDAYKEEDRLHAPFIHYDLYKRM